MAFDFPASPSIDQDYVAGTVTYTYNGTGWVLKGTNSGQFVSKSGDTMTGNLTITKSGPQIILNKTAAGSPRGEILGQIAGSNRWALVMPSGGEDFAICRYDDTGTQIDVPFNIVRLTGQTNLPVTTASTSPTTGALTVAGGVGVGNNLYVSGAVFAGPNGIVTGNGGNSGIYYFGTATNNKILQWDTTKFNLIGGPVAIPDSTASTTSTSGALTVAGGVGIGGAVNSGPIKVDMAGAVTNAINALSGVATSRCAVSVGRTGPEGYITVCANASEFIGGTAAGDVCFIKGSAGGKVWLGNSNVGLGLSVDGTGVIRGASTTASTSQTTGALVVAGGVGIGGALCCSTISEVGDNNTFKYNSSQSPATGAVINVGFALVGYSSRGANDSGTWHTKYENISGGTVGNITTTATTTSYNTTSDERLKDDLRSFDAGKIIDQIEVFDFRWKTTQERDFGVIAQRIKPILPIAVNNLFDTWTIDYSKFVPLLLQEVKSLRERLQQLEDK